MSHPLVDQLRFTRSEFVRGLTGVEHSQAQQRFGNLNCISWIVGHLAWQEQRYWLTRAQGQILFPQLNELLAYGKPACTPPADEMWDLWRQVTLAADPWLDAQTSESLQAPLAEGFASAGTFIYRVIYHTWYHLGEGMAVRQMLGHEGLPDFVGDIDGQAPYRPDSGVEQKEIIRKAEFLEQVRAEWEALESVMARFGDEQMQQPAPGSSWSPKDILAHITWHEGEMLGLLEQRALAGSDLWNLPLEQRNQAIYEQFRDLPLEAVRREASEVHARLLAELQKLDDADLNDPSRFAQMPAEWRPADLLAENTSQHYRDHRLDLSQAA